MRRLLALLLAEALAVTVMAAASAPAEETGDVAAERRAQQALVSHLALTDLALWSDAGYLRHLSAGDRFAPFGDHPAAMEHFPGGSLVPPPTEAP